MVPVPCCLLNQTQLVGQDYCNPNFLNDVRQTWSETNADLHHAAWDGGSSILGWLFPRSKRIFTVNDGSLLQAVLARIQRMHVGIDNAFDIFQHIVVPEAKDFVAFRFQKGCSFHIVLFLFGVLPPVKFYDELSEYAPHDAHLYRRGIPRPQDGNSAFSKRIMESPNPFR